MPEHHFDSTHEVHVHQPSVGDLMVGNAVSAWAPVAGNASTTQKFLTMTGDGVNASTPTWVAAGDMPSVVQALGVIGASTTIDVAAGGVVTLTSTASTNMT